MDRRTLDAISELIFASATYTTTSDETTTTHTWSWDNDPTITSINPNVSYVRYEELGEEVWSDPTPVRLTSQSIIDVEGRVVNRDDPLMLPSGERCSYDVE